MEFHEKLQLLRKKSEMTQEQLAERLFVSRTAISKWESGRGLPNLESLKGISKLFAVSIDDLLSNDELIELAEIENRSNIDKLACILFGILDIMVIVTLFLPLFGQDSGGTIRSVPLMELELTSNVLQVMYFLALTLLPVFGVIQIGLITMAQELPSSGRKTWSLILHAVCIMLFAISRQAYVTTFLFLLFLVKIVLLICDRPHPIRKNSP